MPNGLIVVALTAFTAGQAAPEWKPFVPDAQGYSVMLPRAAKDHTSKSTPSPVDWFKTRHYICDSDRKGFYFSVITHTYSFDLPPEKQAEAFAAFKAGMPKKVGGEVVSVSDLKLATGSGYEMLMRLPKGAPQEFSRGRVIVTPTRIHQFQAFGDEKFVTGADVTRFLDSFKLTD